MPVKLREAAIKGLLGDSEGTNLLKEKPRLFQASATLIEENFATLCGTFDRELVLKAVSIRPKLLYDWSTTNKAVKSGISLPGQEYYKAVNPVQPGE